METERLILRGAQPGDEKDLFEIRNDEFVLRYNCMKPITMDELAEQIRKDMESEDIFCIVIKESGRVIGMIDVGQDTLRYGVKALGLSYYLGEAYTAKGYMTEALREIMRHVFEDREADILSIRAFKDNLASRKLAEKLGFVNEGCIRQAVKGYKDIIYDDMIYSILKEEYEAK